MEKLERILLLNFTDNLWTNYNNKEKLRKVRVTLNNSHRKFLNLAMSCGASYRILFITSGIDSFDLVRHKAIAWLQTDNMASFENLLIKRIMIFGECLLFDEYVICLMWFYYFFSFYLYIIVL